MAHSGSQFSLPDADNMTPLMHAAAKGYTESLKTLIDYLHTEEIDLRDPEGRTALFYAIEGNNPECVNYLLQQGADPNVIDDENYSPLEMCSEISHEAWIGFNDLSVQEKENYFEIFKILLTYMDLSKELERIMTWSGKLDSSLVMDLKKAGVTQDFFDKFLLKHIYRDYNDYNICKRNESLSLVFYEGGVTLSKEAVKILFRRPLGLEIDRKPYCLSVLRHEEMLNILKMTHTDLSIQYNTAEDDALSRPLDSEEGYGLLKHIVLSGYLCELSESDLDRDHINFLLHLISNFEVQDLILVGEAHESWYHDIIQVIHQRGGQNDIVCKLRDVITPWSENDSRHSFFQGNHLVNVEYEQENVSDHKNDDIQLLKKK